MTREEVLAEIKKHEAGRQRIADLIEETIRGIPASRKKEKRDARRLAAGQDPDKIGILVLTTRQRIVKEYQVVREGHANLLCDLEKLRDQPSGSEDRPRMAGWIKRYFPERGYGYIQMDGPVDAYFQRVSFVEKETPQVGDPVTFVRVATSRGRYRAIDIQYPAA